jgi:hypothetical protein
MNKNTKQAKATPNIYHGLDITKNGKCFILEDVHFQFYIFESISHHHIVKEAIHKTWNSLDTFLDEPKQTILAYHDNFFKVSPPKDQDLTLTAQYVWAKIISLAVDRRPQAPVNATGRKSAIGNCVYRPGQLSKVDPLSEGMLKTPQSKICLRLLRECIAANSTPEDPQVTESILRQYIIDHASELKTRQDPWRIFQYYRPELIAEKLITRQ